MQNIHLSKTQIKKCKTQLETYSTQVFSSFLSFIVEKLIIAILDIP